MAADGETGSAADARGSQGVLIGDGLQVNYFYNGTWTDGFAPPPLVSGSGAVDSPYRGLSAFGDRDAAFFFGREAAATEIIERMARCLAGPSLLVISGVSGAGKSSLLRAGVLPRVRGEGLAGAAGSAAWPCLVFTPGPEPLDELAFRVARLAGASAAAVRRDLDDDPAGFALTARQAALAPGGAPDAAPGRLLLVVDQFEQLFTQCPDESQQRAFITALGAAAAGGPDPQQAPAALVVLGVRADFEARCADYPALKDPVQDRYLVTSMTRRQLRMAITEPARTQGCSVEDDLVGVLLAEAGDASGAGVLPLLSHALDQAWRRRAGTAVAVADYERTGGIEGAVAASAQQVYNALTLAQQAAARQVFLRLTATGPDGIDTADRATRADLTAGRDPAGARNVEAVLEAFTAERLLVLAADSVQISHEVLLSAWPLLHDDWLAQTREDRIVQTRLRAATKEWEDHDRDSSYLYYTGSVLETAAETAARAAADPVRYLPLSQDERDFLRASERARSRRSWGRRGAIAILIALTLILAGATVVVRDQRNSAASERDLATAAALAAQSQVSSATDPLLARLEAVAAWQLGHTPAARAAMLHAALLPWDAILSSARAASGQDSSMAFSPGGTMLAVGTNSAIQLWSVSAHQLTATLIEPGGTTQVSSVAFSDDGRLLAALVPGTGIQLWDVATRHLLAEQDLPSGEATTDVPSVAFSANGALIAVTTVEGAVLLAVTRHGPAGGPALSRPVPLPGSASGSLAFSPRGRLLAVGGGQSLQLWSVSGQQPRASLRASMPTSAPPNDISTIYGIPAFSPDGTTVAAGTDFGVQLWQVATGRQLRLLPASDVADTVSFDARGQFLAAGGHGGSAQLWDVATGAKVATLPTGSDGTVDVTFGRGGSLAVLTPGAIRLADLTAILALNKPQATLLSGTTRPAVSVTFSPDGGLLAAGFSGGPVVVWNVARWAVLARLQPARGPALSGAVAFSPDGRLLAAGTEGGSIVIWDAGALHAPAVVFPPGPANKPIDSVAFSPQGDLLAGGTGNGSVVLWKVTGRQRLDPFQPGGNGDPASAIAFSPDGRFLASSSGAGALLWDVASRQAAAVLTLLDNIEGVSSLAFSPDGQLLAAATSSATQLWNITASPPTVAAVVPGHASSVSFSADSAFVAIRAGGTVALWDTATSQELGNLPVGGAGGPVAVSPNGTFVADASINGGIGVWGTPYLASPASYLCRRTGASIPAATWAQLAPGVPYARSC